MMAGEGMRIVSLPRQASVSSAEFDALRARSIFSAAEGGIQLADAVLLHQRKRSAFSSGSVIAIAR